MRHRRIVVFFAAAVCALAAPAGAYAQSAAEAPPDSAAVADTVAAPPAKAELPVYLTVGLGFGRRSDPCASCPSPDDLDSFTGHLSLGKRLGHGLGVGLQGSVWRRGAPGPLGEADSTGVATPTTLVNTLGNASVVFSWQLWHVWLQGGGGVAWVGQDIVPDGADEADHATGMGVGYTVGGGVSLPIASVLSLAFFGNVNAGRYDLTSPRAVVKRGAKHRYVELGVGLTLR